MPWMTHEEENSRKDTGKCENCKKPLVRHYCRTCDEDYFTCGCKWNQGEDHERCGGSVSDASYRY